MHILFTYLVLAFTTGLYSWYLDLRHERTYINPDITVIEVIVGTFICLLFAGIALPADSHSAMVGWLITCGAFLSGGLPVVLWQLARIFYRRGKRAAFKKKGIENAIKTNGTPNH
jgi:hypothetical protein